MYCSTACTYIATSFLFHTLLDVLLYCMFWAIAISIRALQQTYYITFFLGVYSCIALQAYIISSWVMHVLFTSVTHFSEHLELVYSTISLTINFPFTHNNHSITLYFSFLCQQNVRLLHTVHVMFLHCGHIHIPKLVFAPIYR